MPETYWAADHTSTAMESPDEMVEEQGTKLVDVLHEKVELFQRRLKSGPHWRRILRNIRYYHGNFYPYSGDALNFELKVLERGHLGVAVNHYRNILDQILQIATGDRIAFKTRATNSEQRSIADARLGDGIIDYYVRDLRVNRYFKTGANHALVLNSGFTYIPWDAGKGEFVDGDASTGERFFQGDFEFSNPTIADVAFDYSCRDWKLVPWVIVRTPVNKWDLAAKFPQARAKILDQVMETNDFWFYQGLNPFHNEDTIYRYDFYHKHSDAIPEGRHVAYIPGALLMDEFNPYKGLPLFRCVHGEFLLNCLGYSVANDLQALQECENGAVSAISTALAAHGVGHVWMKPGDNLTAKNFEGGLRALVSDEQPMAINFTAIPPELWKAAELYIRAMEYLSGINAVRRGQPEANLRTGKALQLVAAQAVEAASQFAESYREMCEDAATHMLRCIHRFGKGERLNRMLGAHKNQYQEEKWTPDRLGPQSIDRVVVDSINPLAGTLMGRLAMADDLAQKQLVRNFAEYNTLVASGNIQPLLEYEEGQLNLVREENERMLKGGGVLVLPFHPHVLHIKEHSVLLSSLRNTENHQIRKLVLGHIMQHVTQWMNPNPQVQVLQAALSNEPPPFVMPPPGMGPGGPPGGPPGPGGGPPPNQQKPEQKPGNAMPMLPGVTNEPPQGNAPPGVM